MQRLNDLDLNLFVAFQALYRERSVTRAAEVLGLTQPAVSNRLRRLREALDDPLFVASPRGLLPTAGADAMAPSIDLALASLESTLSARNFDPATAQRHFVLQMSDYAEIVALPSALRAIRAAGPGLTIEVVPPSARVAEALERGQIDIGIGAGMTLPESARVTKLVEDDFVVLSRRGFIEEGGLTLERYLAADHVVVAPRGGATTFVDNALAKHGYQRKIACRIRRFVTAPFLVADSDVLFTSPRSLWRVMRRRLPLDMHEVPFEGPRFTVSMFWHERHHHDPAHIWMRELAMSIEEPSS
ncbi:MAG: LysR family transcriptional regulator [Myxococcota bacterium]